MGRLNLPAPPHPDPSGGLGLNASGNTGVAWTYPVTRSVATLYLVDYNDGGQGATAKSSPTVLGSIVVNVGVNDGWQRLRLEIKVNQVTGYFGGSLGSTNGTKITGTLAAPGLGGVYIGYRERLNNNGSARPFTCDALAIIPARDSSVVDTSLGTAKATTVGTPRAGTNGCPLIGNSSFQLTGIDMVPSGSAFWALGLLAGGAFDLSTIGGQPGSFLYVNTIITLTVSTPASGEVSIPSPIPNNPAFLGGTVDVQVFDIDPALTVPLKIGNSRVLKVRIG